MRAAAQGQRCVLVLFGSCRYAPAMFDPVPEPVVDHEVEAVLEAALRSGSGGLTRATECWMASAAARHLVDRLALAGLSVVRFPEKRLT